MNRSRSAREKAVPVPEVEIVLSRPSYRIGGTVVGTVRVFWKNNDEGLPPPREVLHSLDLFLVGRCRLDPRWHNAKDFQKMYRGSGPSLLQALPQSPAERNNTIPIWSTEPVNVLELYERREGRWDDVKPKPIRLPNRKQGNHAKKPSVSASSSYSTISDAEERLEDRQLAVTFRAELDYHLPHTMSCSSCRYFYTVVVRMWCSDEDQPRWTQMPFTVLTKAPDDMTDNNHHPNEGLYADTPVQQGDCQIMVHSSGLPGALTASELHQYDGQLTVNRIGPALYRHVRRQDPRHLQTMRVADPQGRSVCILSIIGATPICPGSRFLLKFDFAKTDSDNWVPCYQVSACLQADEFAIRPAGPKRVRTRHHQFDTAIETVDPECTDRVCLDLLLPLDAPCTIETDAVSIATQCIVDIVIEAGRGYQNLRLEVPCQVVDGLAAYERNDGEEDIRQTPSIAELLGHGPGADDTYDESDPQYFRTRDISEDLKLLSLHMAGRCGLRPKSLK